MSDLDVTGPRFRYAEVVMTENRRIPIAIVSGFLGSGKTSLVRHLLRDAERRSKRLAVISNEFGALGIDAELLASANDDYVELSGGCVCCKLSDELVVTLEALRTRAQPDAIVIETSGVALPFETQLQLWRDPVREWVDDDVAIVVVNAEQLETRRNLDDTFEQQVSSADLLFLNQIDRVPAEALPDLEAALRAFEPDAPIVAGVHGQLASDLLFPPDPDRVREQRRETPPTLPSHRHEQFGTRVIAFDVKPTEAKLRTTLEALRALRMKGFVETEEGWRLVQGVGPRVELTASEAPSAIEARGRVVVIERVGSKHTAEPALADRKIHR